MTYAFLSSTPLGSFLLPNRPPQNHASPTTPKVLRTCSLKPATLHCNFQSSRDEYERERQAESKGIFRRSTFLAKKESSLLATMEQEQDGILTKDTTTSFYPLPVPRSWLPWFAGGGLLLFAILPLAGRGISVAALVLSTTAAGVSFIAGKALVESELRKIQEQATGKPVRSRRTLDDSRRMQEILGGFDFYKQRPRQEDAGFDTASSDEPNDLQSWQSPQKKERKSVFKSSRSEWE